MNKPCVGFIEIRSIAVGIKATDSLLKKAVVRVLLSQPVSSGKYIIMFDGEVDAVKLSLLDGCEIAGNSVVDSFLLTNIHPAIVSSIQSKPAITTLDALGILETTTCASCIEALDSALKTSDVTLLGLHIGKGISGKAYFIINGEVDEVDSALIAACRIIKNKNTILEKIIIPHATEDLLQIFSPPLNL